jgi:hypothetical protein
MSPRSPGRAWLMTGVLRPEAVARLTHTTDADDAWAASRPLSEIPMARSLPSRSPIAALALALFIAAVATLLALSPQPTAQARKAACPSSSAAHARRSHHACKQSKHTPKATRKSRPHAHSRVKVHRLKRVAGGKKAAKRKPAGTTAKPPAEANLTPAICEDGSSPVRARDGSFSCADESEPGCENGSAPAPSSDGASLVCGAARTGASGSSDATCEDGSAPLHGGDGSFSCADGSEPTCEDGSEPTLTGDGALYCDAAGLGEGAG